MRPISISGSHVERLDGDVLGTWVKDNPKLGELQFVTSVHQLRDHAMQPCREGCNPLTCPADAHRVYVTMISHWWMKLESVPHNITLFQEVVL